jgi:hypothetical protein
VAATVDELLLLAPEREPPAGFDVQVLNRIDARRPRSRMTRSSLMLAAAVLAVAAAAVGIRGQPAAAIATSPPSTATL